MGEQAQGIVVVRGRGAGPGPVRRRRAAPAAGFTLMELMTVIFVIAISATLAGPAFRSATVERKSTQAALDLIRVVRSARSEAIAYGRAHVIRVTPDGGGTVIAVRGITSSCTNQVTEASPDGWVDIFTTADCSETDPDEVSTCMDALALNAEEYSIAGSSIDLKFVASMTAEGAETQYVDICYEPRGAMHWRRGANLTALDGASWSNLDNSATLNGGFLFRFRRTDSGVQAGVDRYVALPLGGQARILR